MKRRMTKTVRVGEVLIGGNNPVSIQSMTTVSPADIESSMREIDALCAEGCEIVRVAVPDMEAAYAIRQLKERSPVPIVADIHFDYRLAIAAVEAGADKIRINPGNIGARDRVKKVADACRERGVPIRVGVNSGSVEKALLMKYGGPTPQALVESAINELDVLETCGFSDSMISIKASDVADTLEANLLLSERTDRPIHLGLTHAGTEKIGLLKSAAAIGGLLAMGVGDTVRVSLTGDLVRQITAAKEILEAVGVRKVRPEVVACPTCGRCRINIPALTDRVEEALRDYSAYIKVAVMGCAVNGPGEAREADIGVAGGNGEGVLFKKGEILYKVPEEMIVEALLSEIGKL